MAPDAAAAVARTLAPDADGRIYIGEGPRVAEFEEAFAAFQGAQGPRPLSVSSCTAALDLAAHLAGIGLGSEVISTPMTCTATNGVLVNRGARIVWADVDPITGLIDPQDVARKITQRTKAIVAVDWAGRSCDYTSLRLAARAPAVAGSAVLPNDVPIIQDAAHHLMVDLSKPHGDYVCWSFQAIKHLTTVDGGMLLVPEAQHTRARLLRWYGLDRESSADFRCSQTITEAGFKYHMNDVAASIGLANLPRVAWSVLRSRDNAEWYHRAFANLPPNMLAPPPDDTSSWWLYCLLVDDRAGLIAHLAERGIASSPVHRRNDVHPAFFYPNGPLPGVDAFSERELAIPCGYWLTDVVREHIAASVLEWAWAQQSTEPLEAVHA